MDVKKYIFKKVYFYFILIRKDKFYMSNDLMKLDSISEIKEMVSKKKEEWIDIIKNSKNIIEKIELKDRISAIDKYLQSKKDCNQSRVDLWEVEQWAERSIGQDLIKMKEEGEIGQGTGSNQYKEQNSTKISLANIGLSHNESSQAQKKAKISEKEFENLIDECKEQEDTTKQSVIKRKKNKDRTKKHKEKKESIIKNLTYKTIEEITKQYDVIYADPPWEYENKKTDGYGAAEGHYLTMTIDNLKKMNIDKISKKDCILFIWVTSPNLDIGIDLIRAWKFKYKSSFIWDKINHNMGYYNSVRHEFLLIATKGSITPWNKKLFDSVYSKERTEHSKKPEYFYEVIETLYPGADYIELFARNEKKGWDSWGNQI